MSIEVADSLNVGKTDVVLDVRSRIEKEEDIYNIKYPVRGGLVYCIENEKFYVIKTLVAADVNGYTIANYKVGTYEELNVGGAKYSAGSGIEISASGVISCTVEGGGAEYTAGDGISISDKNVISVDFNTVAKKSDVKSYSGSDNISISSDGKIDITDKVALKSDLKVGEVVADYNKLDNKPLFAAGAGIEVGIVRGGALQVSGAGNTDSNGTYELADYNAIGTARVWQKANRKIYHDGTKWLIDSDTDGASFYYSATGDADPWTLTFAAALSDFGVAPTVALVANGMSDKVQYAIKGVPNSLKDGFIGLYTDADGLHFTTNLIVTKAELSQQLGDINSILDNINGEVI